MRNVDERLRQVEPIDVERGRTGISTDLVVVAELDERAHVAVRLKVGEHEQPMQVVGLARARLQAEERRVARLDALAQVGPER